MQTNPAPLKFHGPIRHGSKAEVERVKAKENMSSLSHHAFR